MSVSPLKRRRPADAVATTQPASVLDALDVNPSEAIVAELHSAMTTKQRLAVYSRLRSYLSSRNETLDGNPIDTSVDFDSGIFHALTLQLNFILHHPGTTQVELKELCEIIDTIFRSCQSEEVRERAITDFGSHLFDVLVLAMKRGAVTPVASIIHSISSCHVGTTRLLRRKKALVKLLDLIDGDDDGGYETAVREALGCFKNLSYFAMEERRMLLDLPRVLPTLITRAFRVSNAKEIELLSAVFRNLAVDSDCRSVLVNEQSFFDVMSHFAKSVNRVVLRNTLNALVSLAMEYHTCLLILLHADGEIVSVLTDILMEEKTDNVARKRAARAFRLLANSEAAPLLVHDSQLIHVLSDTALHDSCKDVRREAAEAFGRCAAYVEAGRPQHEAVLNAIALLAKSPHISPEVLARVLRDQTADEENCWLLSNRKELLEIIAQLCTGVEVSQSAKEDCCCALLQMTLQPRCRKVMALASVLDALSANISHSSLSYRSTCDFAIKALLNLASIDLVKAKIAKHSRVLQSLIRFASTSPDCEEKDDAKKLILELVQQL